MAPKQSKSKKKGGGGEPSDQDARGEPGAAILAGDAAAQARLAEELKLTDVQKAKLTKIFDEAKALAPAGDAAKAEGKAPGPAGAPDMRARIAEILDGEQKTRFEQLLAPQPSRPSTKGAVWVRGPGGSPAPMELRLGITDGSTTELVSGDLKEGTEVLVGVVVPSASENQSTSTGLPRRSL
jgi:HlyD family secretion protein